MVMERWRPRWGLRPWHPIRGFEETERRMENLFRRPWLPMTWRQLPTEAAWAPAIEMFEKEGRYVVKAELPGMKQEEIDISVVGDTLTIKGERKTETEVKEEDYYCCESSYGSFFRSIALSPTVDPDKIKASYENGILEVILPKAVKVKPKKSPSQLNRRTSLRSARKSRKVASSRSSLVLSRVPLATKAVLPSEAADFHQEGVPCRPEKACKS